MSHDTESAKRAAIAKSKEEPKRGGSGMDLEFVRTLGHGKRLSDISIPKELDRTIPTRISFVDAAFGDYGFTPSQSILLTGTSGAGKTTLSLQVAEALQEGGDCVVLYNSNEEAGFQVRKVARRLDLKCNFYFGEDRLTPKIIEHLELIQSKNKGKQVVLIGDSIQSFDDGFYANGGTNSMTGVRVTKDLISWTKRTYGIAILIGQVNKDGEFEGRNIIKHAVDTHAHLYIDLKKRSETYKERIFEVGKNRMAPGGREYVVGMNDKGLYEKMDVDSGDEE